MGPRHALDGILDDRVRLLVEQIIQVHANPGENAKLPSALIYMVEETLAMQRTQTHAKSQFLREFKPCRCAAEHTEHERANGKVSVCISPQSSYITAVPLGVSRSTEQRD
jgi:hypothetical protein